MPGCDIRILVLGASGMLGSACFHYFNEYSEFEVVGTLRDSQALSLFSSTAHHQFMFDVDVSDLDRLKAQIVEIRPDVVVNCIGVVKQLSDANDPLVSIPINALLPHHLASICVESGARLVHVSTDCVFSGSKGSYLETDVPDANDLYGRSKLLGEVTDPPSVTLRTSIIGPELRRGSGLLSWFLKQEGSVSGYRRAFFSGVSTDELARVIRQYVLPNRSLSGLYHLSADRISKYELLQKFATAYGRRIDIRPSDELMIDRSLDSRRFKEVTGYESPSWDDMLETMVKANKRWGSS